jgi:hypothetical protein
LHIPDNQPVDQTSAAVRRHLKSRDAEPDPQRGQDTSNGPRLTVKPEHLPRNITLHLLLPAARLCRRHASAQSQGEIRPQLLLVTNNDARPRPNWPRRIGATRMASCLLRGNAPISQNCARLGAIAQRCEPLRNLTARQHRHLADEVDLIGGVIEATTALTVGLVTAAHTRSEWLDDYVR